MSASSKKPSRLSVLLNQVRLSLIRLPKNIRSNRWWVLWNGRLYISSRNVIPALIAAQPVRGALDGWLSGAKSYTLYSRRWVRTTVDPESCAAYLPELGMFGNMVKRLATAFTIAGVGRFGHVVVPQSAIFHSGIFAQQLHTPDTSYRVWFGEQKPRPRSGVRFLITGNFFNNPGVTVQDSGDAMAQAWSSLHHMLDFPTALAPLEADHLVIHLRGGDVYGPRKPASYGQPPLAYYQAILEHQKWSAVTVVHEDSRSPVLEPLLDLAGRLCPVVTTQSGSLQEDLAFLLSAHTLVAGRGTFVPAIVGISRCVSQVYFFEDKFSVYPPVPKVKVVKIYDAEGSYRREILSGNWENSPAQRDLMLSYPVSNLAWEKAIP